MAITPSQARSILDRIIGVSAAVGIAGSIGGCAGAKQDGASEPIASPTVELACSDGKDDDGDGKVDCADEDCSARGMCNSPSLYAAPC